METRNYGRWSELPTDMLTSLLERLSVVDFQRSKLVCSNWYLCSKQTVRPKHGPPLLMLSLEEDGCVLYSPDEDRVYETTTNSDFLGYRFLASSGKWFLVGDSLSKLYIIDVFSEERIDLPPLESTEGGPFRLERKGAKEFNEESVIINGCNTCRIVDHEDLRGVLWVDDKNGDYVVVWQFGGSDEYLGFCKKGDDRYREIPTRIGVQGLDDMVLKGYNLYVLTSRHYIRHLDLSRQDGFKDVSENHMFPLRLPNVSWDEYARLRANKVISSNRCIAVTTSGEVLYVITIACETSMIFHVYKRDPKDLDPNTHDTRLVHVDSLGDEALFLDLGITVKVAADHTLGIEPNSIYFTRGDRIRRKKVTCLDLCVYNLATKTIINDYQNKTKTIKRFLGLCNLNVKDAQWFLPR
ncbi:unnamed protein product [Microthlaspi erraticum]|uniref:F-box domain-containing protein n=1 Tax=Microthlaspi erraticum TaxID=1685480 RepID=A0A6D2IG36_9BRAS|nr:unnamed protein product [Microthlaspi erraticum]